MSKRASAVAKGIAILLMMFHHMFFSADVIANQSAGVSFSSFPFSQEQLVAISFNFKVCVSVFVFVTGYGIYRQIVMRGMLDQNPAARVANYSVQHIVKLWLNFLCVFVFVHVVCAVLGQPNHWFVPFYGGRGALVGFGYFVIDVLGLSNIVGMPSFCYAWWYMGLAYFLLCLMPLVVLMRKKVDPGILCLMMLLGFFLSGSEVNLLVWFAPIAVFGAFCAEHNIFERLFGENSISTNTARKPLISIGLLAVAFVLFKLRISLGLYPLIDMLVAFCVCGFSVGLEGILAKIGLAYVGNHSLNIFLIHVFFLSSRIGIMLYSLGWFGFAGVALLLISLVVSVLLEKGKDLFGIPKLISRASQAIANSCWEC